MKRISYGLGVFLMASFAFGHGMSESDKALMLEGGLPEYIYLGSSHMVTGYDHLLFIFGVIFFLTKFKDIVKFITVFTVGHSITLIFATFMGIQANAYLIDAVIALTVVYKGFDNIDGFRKYLKVNPPNMLALVFVFGLIHGFGLSTRLQDLPLGHDGLLTKILAFNVGVELGQIAALAAMMLLLAGWRKRSSFARFSKAFNIGLMLAGMGLFALQVNGYFHDHGHHVDHEDQGDSEGIHIDESNHGETSPGHTHDHGHDHDHGHSHDH